MNIGILGGTFDPIHDGHLAIANHVLKKYKLSRIDFIPCFQPPHRDQPIASPVDRLAMVTLAIKNHPELNVNDIEIKRSGVSYTVDTLQSLHQQFPENQYYFILGSDQFAQLDTWHQWEKIIALANIVVVSRHDEHITMPEKIADFTEKNNLKTHIHFCTMTPIDISATRIRAEIANKKEKKETVHGLAKAVHEYALKNHIYC